MIKENLERTYGVKLWRNEHGCWNIRVRRNRITEEGLVSVWQPIPSGARDLEGVEQDLRKMLAEQALKMRLS